MVIDTHIHIIVPEITLEAAPDETWRPSVTWKDGEQTVMNRGRKLGSVLRPYSDIEKIRISLALKVGRLHAPGQLRFQCAAQFGQRDMEPLAGCFRIFIRPEQFQQFVPVNEPPAVVQHQVLEKQPGLVAGPLVGVDPHVSPF